MTIIDRPYGEEARSSACYIIYPLGADAFPSASTIEGRSTMRLSIFRQFGSEPTMSRTRAKSSLSLFLSPPLSYENRARVVHFRGCTLSRMHWSLVADRGASIRSRSISRSRDRSIGRSESLAREIRDRIGTAAADVQPIDRSSGYAHPRSG